MNKKFDIFISYRRKGGYDTAKHIYDRLKQDGYSVSFDIDTLVNGDFDKELEQRVSDCKDFLLVLSPGVFDRLFKINPEYDPENDWVRREIICAFKTHKNIVPLMIDGFAFPKELPDEIKDIANKNGIDFHPKYFEAAYGKMKTFMVSKPSLVVRHKKKIYAFVFAAFLALATFLGVALYNKDYLMDSYQEAKLTLDSVQQAMEQMRERRQQPRTFHWNGPSDEIGQVIFWKIAEAGVQKTACSGRGINISINEVNCRGEAEIICYYVPEIIFANCNNRPITYLKKQERLRTEPKKDSAAAMDEIANKLREIDFSDWVNAIKEFDAR